MKEKERGAPFHTFFSVSHSLLEVSISFFLRGLQRAAFWASQQMRVLKADAELPKARPGGRGDGRCGEMRLV